MTDGFRIWEKWDHPVTVDHMIAMNCGRRFWNADPAKIEANYGKVLTGLCQEICSFINDGRCLIISGPSFSGKTAAAVILGKHVFRYGGSAYIIRPNDLLEAKETGKEIEDGCDVWGYFERIDLLILDDVGSPDTVGRFGEQHVENMVRRRYNKMLSTVVTTPLAPVKFSELYPSVWSMLMNAGSLLLVSGQDWTKGDSDGNGS